MKKSYLNILLLICAMILLILVLDVFAFKNIAIWPLYLLPLLAAAWLIPRRIVISLGVVCTALILLDFFYFSPVSSRDEFINRLLGIAVIWTVTIISLKYNSIKSKLENSEALLSSAQALAHLGSFKIERFPARKLFFTEESKRIFGFDPNQDEISFDSAVDLIHPEDKKKTWDKVDTAIRQKQPLEIEYRILLPDGSMKYIYSVGQPIVGRNGNVDCIQGMLMDVTHQKLSIEILNQSNEKFSKIFRSSPVSISISNADSGLFIDVNDAFVNMVGYAKEEIIGHTAKELGLWADYGDRKRLIDELHEKGRVENFEGRIRRKSGQIADSLSSAEIIKINGANCILSLYLDITARNCIENDLKKSELLFRQVWENSFDGMRLLDKDGIIVRVNESFCRMVKMNREDLEGKVFTSIYGKFQDEKYRKGLERISSGNIVTYVIEEFILWNGERRWFEVSNNILEIQEDAPLLLSVFRDVTERKAADEKLKSTVRKLANSNKNLEEFAYVASHDLQEPLRMISNYTQLLASKYGKDLNSNAMEYISFAQNGAKRMQELIKNLLDYSRVSTKGLAFEELDCTEVFKNVTERMKISIDETGAVIEHSDLPKIKGDVIQIEQLFQNLISNSIKFRGDRKPLIYIAAEQRENEWQFCFRDNGIGIDPKFKDRIFVIFQRLHSLQEYPGTGIGLAFCKKIVERHGGNIWMESEKGKGTTFFFTIPK